MIPGWFESPESQLSNHPGIIKNGSVYSRVRTRFWSHRYIMILPPLHYKIPCRVRARRSHDAEPTLRFQPYPIEFCVVCVPGAHTTRNQRYFFNHILPNSVSCACQALTRRGTSVTFSTMSYRVLCRVRARRSHDAATKNRVRNRLYTDPFIMAPGWFESCV